LKKPKLLLLDEATSALDTVNESEILKTLRMIRSEYTTISVTHRKRVLGICDKIFELKEDGSVSFKNKRNINSGNHLALPSNAINANNTQ
jgi:ABC-type bacteriocin/lantibiotic exporter with double-glycine peptidase domain